MWLEIPKDVSSFGKATRACSAHEVIDRERMEQVLPHQNLRSYAVGSAREQPQAMQLGQRCGLTHWACNIQQAHEQQFREPCIHQFIAKPTIPFCQKQQEAPLENVPSICRERLTEAIAGPGHRKQNLLCAAL
jgi:hypothetical protein